MFKQIIFTYFRNNKSKKSTQVKQKIQTEKQKKIAGILSTKHANLI